MWTIALVVLCSIGGYLWWTAINANPTVVIPTPTMPTPNAFDDFNAAGRSLVDGDKIGFAVSPSPTVTAAAGATTPDDHAYTLSQKTALVTENEPALRLLRQGFSYSYQAPPDRSFTAFNSYYAPDRGLARLLYLAAQVKSAQGDDGGAVGSCLDAVQEGEMLPRGGPLIGMLVGVACQAIGRRQAWAKVGRLNAPQAAAAARRLERIEALHVPYADVLQEEEWATQAGLMEMFRQPDWIKSFFADAGEDGTPGPGLMTRLQLASVPKRTIISHYTVYMNQTIATAHRPYAARIPPPPLPTDPFNAILIPTFEGAHLKDANSETQNALLMVTLALHAYRLEHGAYPATLNALVPGYLAHVPDDPFALSGPLRYKESGANYVLYSVGPDGKDDGGRPIFDATKPAPAAGERDRRYGVDADSTGDIVAGVNES